MVSTIDKIRKKRDMKYRKDDVERKKKTVGYRMRAGVSKRKAQQGQ